jgi:hypothetical protein
LVPSGAELDSDILVLSAERGVLTDCSDGLVSFAARQYLPSLSEGNQCSEVGNGLEIGDEADQKHSMVETSVERPIGKTCFEVGLQFGRQENNACSIIEHTFA